MVTLKKEHSDFHETNRKYASSSYHHSRISPTQVGHRGWNRQCSRDLCFDRWSIVIVSHLVTPVEFLINVDRVHYDLRSEGSRYFPLD